MPITSTAGRACPRAGPSPCRSLCWVSRTFGAAGRGRGVGSTLRAQASNKRKRKKKKRTNEKRRRGAVADAGALGQSADSTVSGPGRSALDCRRPPCSPRRAVPEVVLRTTVETTVVCDDLAPRRRGSSERAGSWRRAEPRSWPDDAVALSAHHSTPRRSDHNACPYCRSADTVVFYQLLTTLLHWTDRPCPPRSRRDRRGPLAHPPSAPAHRCLVHADFSQDILVQPGG